MKRNILYILLSLIGLAGCEFLDYKETSYFDDSEQIFSNFNRTKNFLSNIYSYLPSNSTDIDGAMRASATDEAEHVWDYSNVQKMNDGRWNPNNPVDANWGTYYKAIRAANLFLKEVEGRIFEDYMYTDDYDVMMQQFRIYPYEARFLRAFYYFELAKRYGDIPLLGDSILTRETANKVEKTSFNNVMDFVVSECAAIEDSLPVSYSGMPAEETGRVTKGAAMALKARAALYAASPLHNTTNDINKWREAASAAFDVIELNQYSLEPNYSNVVNKRPSGELILERREGLTNYFERANFPMGYEGGNTGTCPTQNLVDAYEMQADGLPIDESLAYDPANPYAGRDPRLSKTILLNNSMWKGSRLEAWEGGANGPQLPGGTRTGYYLKKYVKEDVNLDPNSVNQKEHVWVLFRLGEVYLNYAEAMNEAFGPETIDGDLTMTAREAVNVIRSRAGMPDFPAGMTQDEFRGKLRNERRVELAFEDHRFWDVRRWKIGAVTKDIYGMKITKEADDSFTYEKVLVENRVWDDKMYLYPIPQEEVFKNDNLTQNTGWVK